MNVKKSSLALVLLPLLSAVPSPTAAAEDAVPLERAVREGKVEIEIKGTGTCTGDAIKITVQRRVPETLRLKLTSGIVFKSVSKKAQDMVGASIKGEYVLGGSFRAANQIVLRDGAKHTYLVEAYCLDSDKPTPDHTDAFAIGRIDVRAQRVFELAQKMTIPANDVQTALWMDRAPAGGLEINVLTGRLALTNENLQTARTLLRQMNPNGLAPWMEQLRIEIPTGPAAISSFIPSTVPPLTPRPAAPLRVLAVQKHDEVVFLDEEGNPTLTKKAPPKKSLLVVGVVLTRPGRSVSAGDFVVETQGLSIPALALSPGPVRLDPSGTPKFRPQPRATQRRPLLGRLRNLQSRWQLVFEIPETATQGKLTWWEHPSVEWSLEGNPDQ